MLLFLKKDKKRTSLILLHNQKCEKQHAAGGMCTLAAVLQIDGIIFGGTMYLIGIFCIWSDYSIQIRNILL